VVLVAAKLAITSDLSIQIVFSPHDDSLYVKRALELLHGDGFGHFDLWTPVNYPGISLGLATIRLLGVPFLLTVNVLHVADGIYVAVGFLRCGLRRLAVFAALALYRFNPVTFGYEWIRMTREPLDTEREHLKRTLNGFL